MTEPEGGTAARVTLSEVADVAGVSRAAASLALRGKPGVAEMTRQRILTVASDLGYRVRPFAIAPATGTIGLLVKSRPVDVGTPNAFYGEVIAGISQACAESELDLRLDTMAVDEHFDPVEVPRMIQTADIDGLIVLGAFLSAPAGTMIGEQPVILVDGYAAEPNTFASIVSDNVGGTASATRHLIELGHRRVALVGTSPDTFPSIVERRRGYESAMLAARLEAVFVDAAHDDPAACAAATARMLAADPSVTALVAANDAVALTLLAELPDRVPREISVVGFDDIEAAGMIRPRLDTVAVDKRAMGRLAVSLLRHRIANPGDPSFTLVQHARLIIRESSAPPPK